MYDDICRVLLDNGARLIYTTSRAAAGALDSLKGQYPAYHWEISTNEKIAYELAFTGSIVSKRTACLLSTEGLYKALDPVMSSAYMGVVGGFVIVCVRETEEEITAVGPFSKMPLLIAEGRGELARSVEFGYYISEKYEIPVLIQAAVDEENWGAEIGDWRLDIGEQKTETGDWRLEINNPKSKIQNPKLSASRFVKNSDRWAATPRFRYGLHKALNEKTEKIRAEFEDYKGNVLVRHNGDTGVITDQRSQVEFYGEDTNLLYLATIYPLPTGLVERFIKDMDKVFVLEGQYPAIELQIGDRRKVKAERLHSLPARPKPAETMHGFAVVRDKLGPASSINMAHGIKKTDPHKKILAITYENHFFHSGMPAFVNSVYNDSAYVLLIMTGEREEEIRSMMAGCGFDNCFHLSNVSEVERFKDSDRLTVLFCKGII